MKCVERTSVAEYILRLERGDMLPEAIVQFCAAKGIRHATLEGIGAVKNARVGYYDLSNKKYESKTYRDAMEVTPIIGNIAEVDGAPFLHAHVVLSDRENTPIAGHLFEAEVAVTLEISVRVYTEPVTRILDEDIGLKLLKLG